MRRKTIVIAGPTASGKSALAVAAAKEFDGVVINADSMQVYDLLRVITARPSPEDEAQAPHRLYGILPPDELCSAGRWQDMARAEVEAAWSAGKLPILTGGTGLYIRALIDGLSPIPDIPDDIRAQSRAALAQMGNDAFHAMLGAHDPIMAARLHPSNSQRLARAWEVLQATGRSIAEWQDEPNVGGVPGAALSIVIAPPREQLYAACNGRFEKMIEQGGLDEVAALDALNLDPALPACKALGVPELRAYLHGRMDLAQAIAAAQQATRNYARRQMTWFRNQINAQIVISAQYSEQMRVEIFPKIRQFLLTGAE